MQARRDSDLRAISFTLAAVLVYRLGCHIPLPGLEANAFAKFAAQSGIETERLSIFALGLTPIFSVLMLFETARLLFPRIARWEAADAGNAQRLAQMLRGASLAMAAFQAFGLAPALEDVRGIVAEPGWPFRIAVILTLVAATAFLSWLADEITRRGFGSGFWILLSIPVVEALPRSVAMGWLLAEQGAVSAPTLLLVPAWMAVSAFWLVALDKARSAALPGVRLAGVWPPVLGTTFASWITGLSYAFATPGSSIGTLGLSPGEPGHLLVLSVLIAGFSILRLMRAAKPDLVSAPEARAALRRLGVMAGLTQAGICGVGALLAQIMPVFVPGMWLIILVMLAERIIERSAANPTPEKA